MLTLELRCRATNCAAVPAWANTIASPVNHGRLEGVRDLVDFDHDAVAADTKLGIDLAIFIGGMQRHIRGPHGGGEFGQRCGAARD